MNMDSNRFLMQFEQILRELNRDIINSEIDVLSIDDLRPVAELVARSRAAYLKRLFAIANTYSTQQGLPDDEEMDELRKLRQSYLELADASKSIEVAIQRKYLDIGRK